MRPDNPRLANPHQDVSALSSPRGGTIRGGGSFDGHCPHVRVKPELVEEFCRATVENGRASVQEPGVARFDVLQQEDDATRFVLIEIYRDGEAAAAHKRTAHYPKWRDAVAPMMAEPRSSVKYNAVFPDSQG